MLELINNEFNRVEDESLTARDVRYIFAKNGNTYESLDKWRYDKEVVDWFPEANEVLIGQFGLSNSKMEFGNRILDFVIVILNFEFWVMNFEKKNKDYLLKQYHLKKGMDYQTKEEILLESIEAYIQLDDTGCRVFNTSKQCILPEIEHEQKIKLNGRRTEKKARKFFHDYMQTSVPTKMYLYPDLVVKKSKLNSRGNPVFEFYELERTVQTEKFKRKLFKHEMAQRQVNFIIVDYLFDYYYKLIEEFLLLDFVKHKHIRLCKLSEFEEQGLHALKYVV